jgi:hypothetical protein
VAPIPFTRLFGTSGRRAVESIVPRRTFDDVILPPATRRALDTALAQVTQHDLIFNRWGLGERVVSENSAGRIRATMGTTPPDSSN